MSNVGDVGGQKNYKVKVRYSFVKPKLNRETLLGISVKKPDDGSNDGSKVKHKTIARVPLFESKKLKKTDLDYIDKNKVYLNKKNEFDGFLESMKDPQDNCDLTELGAQKLTSYDIERLSNNVSFKILNEEGNIASFTLKDSDELLEIISRFSTTMENIRFAVKYDLNPLEAIALFLFAKTPLNWVPEGWHGYNLSALAKIREKSDEDLPKYGSVPKNFATKYKLEPEEGDALYIESHQPLANVSNNMRVALAIALVRIRDKNPDALQDFLPSGATDGEKYALLLGLPNPVDLTEKEFEALTNFLSPDITLANIDNKDRHTLAKTLLKIRATNPDALQGFLPSGATDGEKYALLLGLPNPVDLTDKEFNAFVNYNKKTHFNAIPKAERKPLRSAFKKLRESDPAFFRTILPKKVNAKRVPFFLGFTKAEERLLQAYALKEPSQIPEGEPAQFNALLGEVKSFLPEKYKNFSLGLEPVNFKAFLEGKKGVDIPEKLQGYYVQAMVEVQKNVSQEVWQQVKPKLDQWVAAVCNLNREERRVLFSSSANQGVINSLEDVPVEHQEAFKTALQKVFFTYETAARKARVQGLRQNKAAKTRVFPERVGGQTLPVDEIFSPPVGQLPGVVEISLKETLKNYVSLDLLKKANQIELPKANKNRADEKRLSQLFDDLSLDLEDADKPVASLAFEDQGGADNNDPNVPRRRTYSKGEGLETKVDEEEKTISINGINFGDDNYDNFNFNDPRLYNDDFDND